MWFAATGKTVQVYLQAKNGHFEHKIYLVFVIFNGLNYFLYVNNEMFVYVRKLEN